MECALGIPSGDEEAPEKDEMNAKEGIEPPHKKNKKHRKHKSKKKKRKKKGEKESSSESGAESDAEPPPPPRAVRTTRASARLAAATGAGDPAGLKEECRRDVITDRADTEGDAKSKKHKRHAAKKKKKKKKKEEKQEKKSPSRSPSESSSASGSESEGEGGKGAGDGKYSPAAASELQDPASKLVSKSKRGEKPEVLGVKKEELSDMDVSPSGGKGSNTNRSEKDIRSPSAGQDEITQTVMVKTEGSHADGTFSHAQELPDIIPKQEAGTARDDPVLKDQANSTQKAKVRERDSSRSRSPSPPRSIDIKRSGSSHSRSPTSSPSRQHSDGQTASAKKERSRTHSRSTSKGKRSTTPIKCRQLSRSQSRSQSPKSRKKSLTPSPKRAICQSRSTSRSLTPKKISKSPRNDAEVPALLKERCHDPLNVGGAGPPPYLGLQGEVEGQSHDPVEAQLTPGPAHLEEVVQLAGIQGHVQSLETAAPALNQDALYAALGRDHWQDVQEAVTTPQIPPLTLPVNPQKQANSVTIRCSPQAQPALQI
ncbi:hypothetical protein FQN60_001432 [Etheostoma spectabile]|uniref:Serine/arginine repetitive matrix protein 2-like n=1 Tax=Etheostoma spectabile TaxID=54343 RepID=A0A5J5D0F6_9PERO|nr:hypothetical protein FQN60_001432 [Etheostoma spectabile]